MIGRTNKFIGADVIKIVAAIIYMLVLWPIGWLMEPFGRGKTDRYREALAHIAGDINCETFTGRHSCRDAHSGRTRDAYYGGDRWCDVCVARDALERE